MANSKGDQKSSTAAATTASEQASGPAPQQQPSTSDAMLSVAPPPYTEPLLPSNERPVAYNSYGSTNSNYPRGPSVLPPNPSTYAHHQHLYQQQQLPATVFDERILREADRRARRRFLSAFLWAFVIWTVVGLLAGGISAAAVSQGRQQRRHRHHDGAEDWAH
ncbi:hypothetical protein ACM66B_000020 [Microbotryomycetes sp. NB124-2]